MQAAASSKGARGLQTADQGRAVRWRAWDDGDGCALLLPHGSSMNDDGAGLGFQIQ